MGTATRTSLRHSVASILGFVALVAAVTVASLVAATPDPAAASGLERFDSCAAISDWTASTAAGAAEEPFLGQQDAPSAARADAAAPIAAGEISELTADGSVSAGQGGTNTVVQGVDEIDVTDRVGDDRVVIARNGALALVDLRSRSVLSELLGMPGDARVSVDGDLVWVVGSKGDGGGTTVRRVTIGRGRPRRRRGMVDTRVRARRPPHRRRHPPRGRRTSGTAPRHPLRRRTGALQRGLAPGRTCHRPDRHVGRHAPR